MAIDASEPFRDRLKRWSRTLPAKFEQAKKALALLFIVGGGAGGFLLALRSGGLLAFVIWTAGGAVLGALFFAGLRTLIGKVAEFAIGIAVATAFFLILTAILSVTL